jgi:hypothetical protein
MRGVRVRQIAINALVLTATRSGVPASRGFIPKSSLAILPERASIRFCWSCRPTPRSKRTPHRDNRVAVVVSGEWHLGYGDHFDAKSLKTLPPGSVCSEPGGDNHFARTGADPVVVEISGYGPPTRTIWTPGTIQDRARRGDDLAEQESSATRPRRLPSIAPRKSALPSGTQEQTPATRTR